MWGVLCLLEVHFKVFLAQQGIYASSVDNENCSFAQI